MPAKRTFEFVSVAVFSAALAYFGALAQWSARVAVAENRLATVEQTSTATKNQVTAIYNALVKRGIITVRNHGNAKEKAAAKAETALAIADSVGRGDLCRGLAAPAGGLSALSAVRGSCRQGAWYRPGDSGSPARDRAGELAAVGGAP